MFVSTRSRLRSYGEPLARNFRDFSGAYAAHNVQNAGQRQGLSGAEDLWSHQARRSKDEPLGRSGNALFELKIGGKSINDSITFGIKQHKTDQTSGDFASFSAGIRLRLPQHQQASGPSNRSSAESRGINAGVMLLHPDKSVFQV